jgi:hypothetical protein
MFGNYIPQNQACSNTLSPENPRNRPERGGWGEFLTFLVYLVSRARRIVRVNGAAVFDAAEGVER